MRAIIGPVIFCLLMLPVQALAQLSPSSTISRITPDKYISIMKANGYPAEKSDATTVTVKAEGLTHVVFFSNCTEDGCSAYSINAIYSDNFSDLQKVNSLNGNWNFLKFSIVGDKKRLIFSMETPIGGGVSEGSFTYNLTLFDTIARRVAQDLQG